MRSRLDDAEFWTNGDLGGAESVVRLALAHMGEVSERAGASR
jgi:hypothetical protein